MVSIPRSKRPPHVAGLAAIALAATLWAIAAAVASRLFERGVEPLELAEARALIATAGFAALSVTRRRERRERAATRPYLLLAFGLSIALVNAVYYLAIERLAVAVAIVLQYTSPAFVVVYTALSKRKRPAPQILWALLLALTGVVFASELPAGNIGDLDTLGIAFAITSGILFATYTVLSEKIEATYGPVEGMLRAFAVASGFWIVFQAFRGWPAELFEPENLLPVLYVGLAGTLAPFLLYVWAIARVAPERATIAATVEPAAAGVVAWVWLGQSLSGMQIAGGVMVLFAIVALQAKRKEPLLAPEP